MEGVARFFRLLFFLKTTPHTIIEMPRLVNAINAAKPCIKPWGVGSSPGISVGNIATSNIPIQKILSVILLVLDDVMLSSNPLNSKAAPNASA